MTGDCSLAGGFGEVGSCQMGDDDNNGLWTSLVVVAEYLRHAVTGEQAALASASA